LFSILESLKDQLVKEIQEEYNKFYPKTYSINQKHSDLNYNLLKRLDKFIHTNIPNIDSKIVSMFPFGLHLIISDNIITCLLYIPTYIFESKINSSFTKTEMVEFMDRDILISKV
jgi:hypothetical protein